jgi:methyl-accepting chemotaxis protein
VIKNLKIRNKILLGIGISLLVGSLVIGGVIYYQFNSLVDTSHDSLKENLLDKEREKIKQLAQTKAQDLAQVYEENKDNMSNEELRQLIADRNAPVRFGDGNYFYVYSNEGDTISLPPDREKEGTNRWELEVSGQYLLQEMAKLSNNGGGFFTYDYENPNTGKLDTKFGYIEPISGTNWFVGAGGYESVINSALQQKRTEINKYKVQTLSFVGLVGGVIILIIIAIIFLISRYLTGNINQLLEGMRKLAAGELDIQLSVDSEDELGKLKTAFNRAVENQQEMVGEIGEVIDDISAYSEELSASAQETDSILEVTTDNVKQLADTTNQVAEGSDEVAQLAQDASQRTETGSEMIEQVIAKLQKADKLVGQTKEGINELDDTSQEITSLIEMITDIAEQTNLLALNASIEAARATSGSGGGHGFAVVAEEIKELAGKTSQTADKAIELIQEVKAKSNDSLESVEAVAQQTADGREMIEETGELFDQLAGLVEDTSIYVQETTASTEELAATSDQVEESTVDVKHMSENVAKSAEELAELAQQLKELQENYTL